jgi:uncharacterized protein DUF6498
MAWAASIFRILLVLALNAVPLWGFTGDGWSVGTVLALYWLQTVISIPLVAGLIILHRRMTRKRGHYRADGSYLANFLMMSVVFALVHGLVLALMLGVVWRNAAGAVDRIDLSEGLGMTAALMALGFVVELLHLRRQPFSWIRFRADALMRRVVVVHLAIVFGMGLAAFVSPESPVAFFWVFMTLKLLVDVGSELPQSEADRARVPRWLAWVARKCGKPDFTAEWHRIVAAQSAGFANDELPVEPDGRKK